MKAATLTQDAKTVLPADPTLDKLWERATGEISIASSPSGAEVSIRPYRSDPNAWETIGRTPLKNFRVPRDVYVWRIGAPGFDPMFFIDEPPGPADPGLKWYLDRSLTLRRTERIPPEMVVVSGGEIGLPSPSQTAPFVGVGDFLIDRHEVTNDQYKRFVDAGGYQRPEFWKQPFVRKGKQIPWEKAVAEFRDGTGRPGSCDLGSRKLSERHGKASSGGGFLVRSNGVCRVCRQEPANGLPLDPRFTVSRFHLADRLGQQLQG